MEHRLRVVELRPKPDRELVATLRQLLKQAEEGEIFGLVYAVQRRRSYTVDIVGMSRRHPSVARIMALDLFELARDMTFNPPEPA